MASVVDEYRGWCVWQDMDGLYHVLDASQRSRYQTQDSADAKAQMRFMADQPECRNEIAIYLPGMTELVAWVRCGAMYGSITRRCPFHESQHQVNKMLRTPRADDVH